MPAIIQPGVSVSQEFTATANTVASPALTPVIVGPCYHVVDAVTSTSTFNSSALAGSYKAHVGSQSFSLPGLSSFTGAILDTNSIRVYVDKLNGTPQAALRSVADETTLVSGSASGVLTAGGQFPIFTDSAIANWQAYGVTARTSSSKGDTVRFTYLGRVYDLEIVGLLKADGSAATASDDAPKLKLDLLAYELENVSAADTFLYGVSASSLDYNVIDKPADYIVKTSAVNSTTIQIGDGASNYFHFEAIGSMAGSAAETAALSVLLKSAQVESGSGDGYSDGALFVSGAIISGITAGDFLAFDTAGTIVAVEISEVIGSYALGLASDAITGSSTDWLAGAKVLNTQTGNTDAGGIFSTTITGAAATHNGNCVVKVNGDSTLKLASLNGSGQLTFNSFANQTSKTLEYIILAEDEGSGNGSEGANTFASNSLSTTASGDYIAINGTYSLTSSAIANKMITVSSISAHAGVDWVSVPASETASARYNATNQVVTIQTGRASGVPSTFADIEAAIAADTTVAALISMSITGSDSTALDEDAFVSASGTIGGRNYYFEGGADANQVILDGNLTQGAPVNVYIGYRALRVDTSAASSDPALITIESIADIEAKIGRSDTTSNPLGLAAKLALTNTVGNVSIKVLGLSAANSAEIASDPDGSVAAYTEALTLLEAEDVYALAPLSSSREVATLFSNHATTMSAAENKGERIAFFSREFPTYSSATLIASGTRGITASDFKTSGEFTCEVDFGTDGANFSILESALDAGDDVILVLNSFKTSAYADIELLGAASEQYGFTVTGVVSSNTYKLTVAIADIATTTTNDLSSQSWYLYKQGVAITSAADQATRVASYGSEYENRRAYLVWPPRCVATVGSNSEFLAGHYLAATVAACVGFQGIAKGFTNLNISGFSALRYSNKHFSKSQLDTIAGGGTMILVQDVESGPLKIRHQLSTDVSTVQRRELSITKSIDYFAKTLRDSLSDRIGGNNITTEFVQGLGMNIQAIIASMVQRKIVTSAKATSIVQDSTNPDTINIVIQVAPLFPCNYIEITLQL